MSRLTESYDDFKAELLRDEEFREKYESLGPRYQVIEQIIAARMDQRITQEELANRIGTKKSNISRLEGGNYNPSLDFLYKVAKGLGKELEIQFK